MGIGQRLGSRWRAEGWDSDLSSWPHATQAVTLHLAMAADPISSPPQVLSNLCIPRIDFIVQSNHLKVVAGLAQYLEHRLWRLIMDINFSSLSNYITLAKFKLYTEKGMATHSSILAWRIPWTEKPGGPQSIGSHRVGHDRSC